MSNINHPKHYGGDKPYEAIKVIEAWCLDFHLGNVVKYIARAGKKSDRLEDLEKAKWYLERSIEKLKGQREEVKKQDIKLSDVVNNMIPFKYSYTCDDCKMPDGLHSSLCNKNKNGTRSYI